MSTGFRDRPTRMPGRPLNADWCRAQRAGRLLGGRLLYLPQTTSTNEEALHYAAAGAPEGTVVVADTQTAGRGRRGRQWQDEPGQSLLFSVLLRPLPPPPLWSLLSLGTAVAVAEALRESYGLPVATKWPNDVVIAGRKLAGLLLEQRGAAVVVGVGLNVNGSREVLQVCVDRPVTTLEAERGLPLSREEVFVTVLAKMEAIYHQFQAGDLAGLVPRYRQLESLLGQAVRVIVGGEQICGVATEVTDWGSLIVATPGGQREIIAGEAEVIADGE